MRGAAGLVRDGQVRDSGAIRQLDFLGFCGGGAPLNLLQHHAVDVNVPIGCGGVAVYPGDIMAGGDEGVVVIPAHPADEVGRDAAEQEKIEAFILQKGSACLFRSKAERCGKVGILAVCYVYRSNISPLDER
ncbi:MAG: hypothetical protein ABI589_07510 [Burkholderiales bacterium]